MARTSDDERGTPWLRWLLRGIGVVVVAIVLVVGLLALLPVSTTDLGAHPNPTTSYPAAIARFTAITQREGAVTAPCRSRLLGPGHATARVVVLFHGFTNCPAQMLPLARQFRDTGATVLVLRAPNHGLPGGIENLSNFDAEALRDETDQAIDIANGLGQQHVLMGISMGGMQAAWGAQERAGITRAVMVAPALQLGGVPGWVADAFVNVFTRVPNLDLPSADGTLPYGYPTGIATRATAEMFRMGTSVRANAGRLQAQSTALAALLNNNDSTVSNGATQALINTYRANGHPVREVVLPASLGLPHDTIDPNQIGGMPKVISPIVVALANGTRLPKVPTGTVVTG